MQANLVEEGTQLLKIFFSILKNIRHEATDPATPETKCWYCSQPIESLSASARTAGTTTSANAARPESRTRTRATITPSSAAIVKRRSSTRRSPPPRCSPPPGFFLLLALLHFGIQKCDSVKPL